MKTYLWNPLDRSVTVLNYGHGRKLRHEVRHSPDGFECGYHGSGPADLALSILADLVGLKEADGRYQAFKRDVIAMKPRGRAWTVTAEEIRTWLAFQRERARDLDRMNSRRNGQDLQDLQDGKRGIS